MKIHPPVHTTQSCLLLSFIDFNFTYNCRYRLIIFRSYLLSQNIWHKILHGSAVRFIVRYFREHKKSIKINKLPVIFIVNAIFKNFFAHELTFILTPVCRKASVIEILIITDQFFNLNAICIILVESIG